jgi:ubiquinone/menaquinone biosynthesis C-methylase UbiE
VAMTTHDIWAQWLLHRRHGGDAARLKSTLDRLVPIRERVLAGATLADGETLLDVGCGDGLIGLRALELTTDARVIFSDISQDLLDVVASLLREAQLDHRCEFLLASAADLSALPDASVDAVALRSVLIYVAEKAQAFREFHRVLRTGGRLSIFEPINRFGHPQPAHLFWGYNVESIAPIASKVKAIYERLQPLDSDPMMDFDERDLIRWAEIAGLQQVHCELEVRVAPFHLEADGPMSWQTFMGAAANPRIPTIEEAVAGALTPDEGAAFTAHLRPLVEAGAGISRSAVAWLSATK